jgi:hypothetical protein
MGVEDVEVEGIAPGIVEKVSYGVNPSKQSSMMNIGNNVLITRPLSEKFTGIKNEQELERRKEAVRLHEENIPEYTLHKGHVVLQGYKYMDGKKESVPILGRLLEKVTNIRKVTELSTDSFLSDIQLCKALTTINAFQLKQLLLNSVLVDSGNIGNFGESYPIAFQRYAKHLTSDNVFVGNDKKGHRKIFCDPDWYIDVPNNAWGIKTKLLHSSRLAARTAFFYGALKAQQIKEVIRPREKTEVKIQRERVMKKAKS